MLSSGPQQAGRWAEHPIPSHREIKQPYHVTMQERKKETPLYRSYINIIPSDARKQQSMLGS